MEIPNPIVQVLPLSEVSKLQEIFPEPTLAIDFETKGVDANHPNQYVVGMGISNGKHAVYIPFDDDRLTVYETEVFISFFKNKKLVAHNVAFDSAWFERYFHTPVKWACTYGYLNQLDTEGKKGLKPASMTYLNIPARHDEELGVWLKTHKLSKSNMWQAPVEILGKYCALDAAYCYLLYEIIQEALIKLPDLQSYHEEEFMNLINLVLNTQRQGMLVDEHGLKTELERLQIESKETLRLFYTHNMTRPHIQQFNEDVITQINSTAPPLLTKSGGESVRRLRWEQSVETKYNKGKFNHQSSHHLRWLLYDMLGCQVYKKTPKGEPSVDKTILPLMGEVGKLLVKHNKLNKQCQYITAALQNINHGRIYPRFKIPGTKTGRLSGGFEVGKL